MTSTPDERLLAAHDIALAAFAEITPAATVGDAAGYSVEDDGVVSLRFANNLPGYVGWFWTVSVAVVEDAEPTVLELELLPGDDALLSPEWVPWAVRLAEYRAAMAAAGEADDEDESATLEGDEYDLDGFDDDEEDLGDDDDDDDDDDLDADDFDEDGSPHLDAGDLDGVDIDSMDDSANFGEDAIFDAVSEDDAERDDED